MKDFMRTIILGVVVSIIIIMTFIFGFSDAPVERSYSLSLSYSLLRLFIAFILIFFSIKIFNKKKKNEQNTSREEVSWRNIGWTSLAIFLIMLIIGFLICLTFLP